MKFTDFQLETFSEDMLYIKLSIAKQQREILTSSNEMEKIFKLKNISSKLHASQGKTTSKAAQELFHTLTNEDIQKFHKAYYFDFLLFNYTIDNFS